MRVRLEACTNATAEAAEMCESAIIRCHARAEQAATSVKTLGSKTYSTATRASVQHTRTNS